MTEIRGDIAALADVAAGVPSELSAGETLWKSDEEGGEIGHPTPLGALLFRMEQGGHTQADLAKLIGNRSRASEILAGKRSLSKAQIATLADEWGIPARSLLGPAILQKVAPSELDRLASRLMSWPIPKGMTCDGCMTMRDYPHQRCGTNMIGVDDARAMLEWLFAETASPAARSDRALEEPNPLPLTPDSPESQ